ncbi:MAG: hypothetical protein ABSF83_03460 [Nitrososphaerales archaeon]|jgi:hypothetical protein
MYLTVKLRNKKAGDEVIGLCSMLISEPSTIKDFSTRIRVDRDYRVSQPLGLPNARSVSVEVIHGGMGKRVIGVFSVPAFSTPLLPEDFSTDLEIETVGKLGGD